MCSLRCAAFSPVHFHTGWLAVFLTFPFCPSTPDEGFKLDQAQTHLHTTPGTHIQDKAGQHSAPAILSQESGGYSSTSKCQKSIHLPYNDRLTTYLRGSDISNLLIRLS